MVLVIIIMKFGENVLRAKYIDIYQFQDFGGRGGYMVYLTFFCLLFIKIEKAQEHACLPPGRYFTK